MADQHHHHHNNNNNNHHHHHSMRTLGNVGKACKSFVLNCYREKKILSPNKKSKTKDKPISIVQDDFLGTKNGKEVVDMNGMDIRYSDYLTYLRKNNNDDIKPSSSSSFSGPLMTSRRLKLSSLSRRERGSILTSTSTSGGAPSLSRVFSSRSIRIDHGVESRRGPTAIMYSNSHGVIKPPAKEMTLECTLEELCFGCVKDVIVERNTLTHDGDVIQEEEVLTIKVKTGWTNGTKITFQGKGNKAPGALPSDVVFTVIEKEHLLYRRENDDLAFEAKIPLVKALTTSSIPIPLLGSNNKMDLDLTLDDIIYPGYKTVIPGQGMPNSQDEEKRGNLIVTFQVEFPTELTDAQRFDIVNILQDSSSSSDN